MNWLRWIIAIVVVGWIGQYPLAMVLPNLVMERLYQQASETASQNKLIVRERPDESFRTVVRPSPDLFYALCFYDLEQGDLTITAQVPERYWSMQFYQMNTDNFAGVTNQRDESYRTGGVTEVTLVGPSRNLTDYGEDVIQSPTERGIMLLRVSAIGDSTQAKAALVNSSCELSS